MKKEESGQTVGFDIAPVRAADRAAVTELFRRAWGDTFMISRGRRHDVATLAGWLARAPNGTIAGVMTGATEGDELEIVSLDSFREEQGVGSALVVAALAEARSLGLRRAWLVTTNNNLRALGFWQRRGFDLVALHREAVVEARRLKPAIPLVGPDGIPLRHELELGVRFPA